MYRKFNSQFYPAYRILVELALEEKAAAQMDSEAHSAAADTSHQKATGTGDNTTPPETEQKK